MHIFVEQTLNDIRQLDKSATDYPSFLEEHLVRTNADGDSAVYIAANQGDNDAIVELLNYAKDYPEILTKVLTQTSHWGDTPFYAAIDHQRKGISEIILGSSKDNHDLLKKVLNVSYKGQPKAFPHAVITENVELVDAILSSLQGNRELKKEILTESLNLHSRSDITALYFSHFFKDSKITAAILSSVEGDPELMQELLDQKPPLNSFLPKAARSVMSMLNYITTLGNSKIEDPDQAIIPLLNHLVIKGDQESIGIILRTLPDIELDNISHEYFSITPQESAYFSPSLLKLLGQNHELRFYQDSHLKTTDNLETPGSPIIVANGQNLSHRVILSQNIENNNPKYTQEALKKALDLANQEGIHKVVLNCGIDGHTATVIMKRDNPDHGWHINLHDPNFINDAFSDNSKVFIFRNRFYELVKDTSKIESLRSLPPALENSIKGQCDSISEIFAAAAITNQEAELYKFCRNRSSCVDELISKILPDLSATYQDRFKHIKANLIAQDPDLYSQLLHTAPTTVKYSMITHTNEKPCYGKYGVNYPIPEGDDQPGDALIASCTKKESQNYFERNALLNSATNGLKSGFIAGASDAFFQKVLGLSPQDARLATSGLAISYIANQAGMVAASDLTSLANPITALIATDLGLRLIGSISDETSMLHRGATALSYLPSTIAALASKNNVMEIATLSLSSLAGNFVGRKAVEIPSAIVNKVFSGDKVITPSIREI